MFVTANNVSKVFLSTDKDVFLAGDSIEILARIYDCNSEDLIEDGDLHLMIKSLNGDIITDTKVKFTEGIVAAKLKIPNWTEQGFFSLVAFTKDAFNRNNIHQIGIHFIYVYRPSRNQYLVNITSDEALEAGKTASFMIDVQTESKTAKIDSVMLQLYDFNGVISSKIISLKTGLNAVNVDLPKEFNTALYFNIKSFNKALFSKPYLVPLAEQAIRVEFFPEGGNILTNRQQKIIYRATDLLGRPKLIGGSIVNAQGYIVGSARSIQTGLGIIETKPASSETYYFIPDKKYNISEKFPLPKIENNGVVITYHNTKNKLIEFNVLAAGNSLDDKAALKIFSKGKLVYHEDFLLQSNKLFSLSQTDLPSGILQISVEKSGKLLSERFIMNQTQWPLGMGVKQNYVVNGNGDSMSISLNVGLLKDYFNLYSYDLKIVPASAILFNEIIGENDYLNHSLSNEFPGNLFEILLANIELIGNYTECTSYGKANLEHGISGAVTDRKGRGVGFAKVLAIHNLSGAIRETISDEGGHFYLANVDDNVFWKAIKDGEELQVLLAQDFETSLNDYLKTEFFKVGDKIDLSNFFIHVSTTHQVFNADDEPIYSSGFYQNDILETIKMMKPFYIEHNQIVFQNKRPSFLQSGALIVVNERPMGTNIEVLNSIDPSTIQSINIYTELSKIQEYTSLNNVGVVQIKTSKPMSAEKGLFIKNANDIHYWFHNLKIDQSGMVEVGLPVIVNQEALQIVIDAVLENGQRIRTTQKFKY